MYIPLLGGSLQIDDHFDDQVAGLVVDRVAPRSIRYARTGTLCGARWWGVAIWINGKEARQVGRGSMANETTTEPDGGGTAKRIRQQRLGIRLDVEPYYEVIEQTDTRLALQSRPESNAAAGRLPMGCGIGVALLMPVIIVAMTIGGGGGIGSVLFGTLLAWPFAAIGYLIWNSGRAVATTNNTITVDAEQQKIVYTQSNRVGRMRSQTLAFDQIDHMRLRVRPVVLPGFPRRRTQVVALEMVTDEGYTWLVDSAESGGPIRPVATALVEILGVRLEEPTAAAVERQLPTAE
jgi:hypothetical protein